MTSVEVRLRADADRLRWRCPPAWRSGDLRPLRGEAEVIAALEAFVAHGRTLAIAAPSGWSWAAELAAWLADRGSGPVVVATAGGARRWRGRGEPGWLAAAHGGVLVADLRDVDAGAWDALREALQTGVIEPDPGDASSAGPRPAHLRAVLVGPDEAMSALRERDERFAEFFGERVAAWGNLPRDRGGVGAVAARLRAARPDLTPSALGWAVEQVARGARRDRIPERSERVDRAVREAGTPSLRGVRAAWASIDERRNAARQAQLDRLRDGVLVAATSGRRLGTVNGLMVYAQNRESYVLPGRITATVGVGRAGITNVEREAKYSGKSFDKGVFQLIGLLRSRWGADLPIELSASLVFEQSHGRVDGDSATVAELLALLSELSGLPARQDIAVTGAIGQRGEVQSVGSVTLKVEGWWRTCRIGGLTGDQGVAMPETTIDDLQLDEPVLADIRAGRFHVWGLRDLDDATELVLGAPATGPGSIHEAVGRRLEALAAALKGKKG